MLCVNDCKMLSKTLCTSAEAANACRTKQEWLLSVGSLRVANCSLMIDTRLDACPQRANSRAFIDAFYFQGRHSSNAILTLSILCAASSTASVPSSYMVSSKAFIKVKQLQGRRGRLPDGRGEHSRLQGGQGGLKLGMDQGQCMLLHSQLVIQSYCLRAKNTVFFLEFAATC